MSPTLWSIALTLGTLLLLTLALMWRYQQYLSTMTLMMGAMLSGMGVGLTLGLYFGMHWKGELLLSTVWSMGAGAFAGLLVSVPFQHPLAAIDGLLSGIMGGMMGAMLSEMLALHHAYVLTQIMLVVTTGLFILFISVVKGNRTGESGQPFKKSWLFKPIGTLLLLAFFFIGIDKLTAFEPPLDHPKCHHEHHLEDHHHGGDIRVAV
ncbi:blue (type 1) copper domain protein [Caldalkalibacillus thermarum TA2.A1]|uniref:Blue (Type 1) copper domain protein n=1 Tax=Caldalkalibacillus thermarum (strain TA2.A1) TaxID=986075 RepID=F5L3U3_CALTT|nr:hypothetical protein [Caldalkalibacillus thermarum]EGL83985.1 blue (type 1) copper domain protein [Caldalkalibacillus thermarum TA2.A1]QZT35052.1 hypothetical protein HUR95_07455 [Caldalkalibacillus thermarum TA2.A1]